MAAPQKFLLSLLLSSCLAPPTLLAAEEQPRAVRPGQDVEITGEVVEIGCYLREGSRGEAHRTCALASLKNGGRLGIVEDGSGLLYPFAGAHPTTNPSAGLHELLARHVAVKGRAYEREGSRVLVPGEIQALTSTRTSVR